VGRDERDEEPVGFLEEVFEHRQVQPKRAAEPPDDTSDAADDDAAGAEPTLPLDVDPAADEPSGAGGGAPPDPAHPGLTPAPGAPGGTGVVVEELAEPEPEPAAAAAAPAEFADFAEPDPLDRALIDEAMKKSGIVWIATEAAPAARAAWYVWLDGSAYVLTGAGQQPDPGFADGDVARVSARSKETRAAMVTWTGSASRLQPSDPQWDVVAPALAKARLNLSDPAGAPRRWAADSSVAVYRIAPAGPLVEGPGSYSDASRRAEPVPTPAVTAGPPPKVVHRRQTARRPLS
jgi:hypothetical protein